MKILLEIYFLRIFRTDRKKISNAKTISDFDTALICNMISTKAYLFEYEQTNLILHKRFVM